MIEASLERLSLLIGEENIEKLQNATVLVVGVGGVGSHAAEALARSGIGHIILIDGDVIQESNLNRQIHATVNTIGQTKTQAMKDRIQNIKPNCIVDMYDIFFDKTKIQIFNHKIDFVIDAIDTISSKLDLLEMCYEKGIPFISSLGMANRFDVSKLCVTTLDKTSYDPLAKAVRYQAKQRNIRFKIPVAFSTEIPFTQNQVINEEGKTRKEKIPPASTSFVPPAAGLMCASYVVQSLINEEKQFKG